MKAAIAVAVVAILLVGSIFAQTKSQSSIQVKGEIIPTKISGVKPKTFGRIKKLHFDIRDRVKAGDLLAEIDVLSAEEALGKPDANLTVKGLPKNDGEPVSKQIDPAFSKIYAPHDGVIATRKVYEGQVVSPGTVKDYGTELLTILDDSTLTIQALVPEAQASRLVLKQPVQFMSDAVPGVKMEAQISYIASRPSIRRSSGERGVYVRALVGKPNPQLRAGKVVQFTIPTTLR
ncbi:MAG: HlyD family efflux transporter periplasmic adaptor subunit [Verrucomicrobiaceae bacterium]|nr:MAG: HlyD family efflux transporter periplasmic adaptor subunit [Verrucomicrobiaceae bacterium]